MADAMLALFIAASVKAILGPEDAQRLYQDVEKNLLQATAEDLVAPLRLVKLYRGQNLSQEQLREEAQLFLDYYP